MKQKTVAVIGGGIAGLSAAVFLAEEGFKINLFEAAPRLGGRTYSFFDKQFGAYIDNGQHILASWYLNTFNYLKIIGSFNKLYTQPQLEVNFINQRAENFTLKASKLPPPLHLLNGLLGFKALKLNDRVAALRLINAVKSQKIEENRLKEINVNILFNNTKQTKKLVERFWKPFIIAVFNAQPEDTSAFMFSEIIKMGFLEKGGSNLVLPDVFLNELLVEPAIDYLVMHNAVLNLNCKVKKINIKNNTVTSIIAEDNTEIKSDYYICCVPFFDIQNILNGSLGVINSNASLSPSPIVNIHLKFEKDISNVIKNRFYGILESNIQWVFRVKNDQLCVVISSAKDVCEMEKEKITSLSKEELIKCFPELKSIQITGTRVIKEMRATFVPDTKSLSNRPQNSTSTDNLFIAGDWTDTGLPATIESAVKSAKFCTDLIIRTDKQKEYLNN